MVPRNPNTHGGGAKTNENGLNFEHRTDLKTALQQAGFTVTDEQIVTKGSNQYGFLCRPNTFDLYTKFLIPRGIHYAEYNSKRWKPDEAFVNETNQTVYIIEKKTQATYGSVDEKLGGCEFKRWEYEKLVAPLHYKVVYMYVFSDWFRKPVYRDILAYIESKQVLYFWSIIPATALGLPE